MWNDRLSNKRVSLSDFLKTLSISIPLGISAFLLLVNFIYNKTHDSEIPYQESNQQIESVQINVSDNEVQFDTLLSVDAELICVIDGDTLLVSVNGEEKKVRLIGIDTPESVNPDESKNTAEGKIASDYLKDFLSETSMIQLIYDAEPQDKYGRELCYVYVDGIMLQEILLEHGYARIMTILPNVSYSRKFEEIQKNAQNNNVGFWGTGYFN